MEEEEEAIVSKDEEKKRRRKRRNLPVVKTKMITLQGTSHLQSQT